VNAGIDTVGPMDVGGTHVIAAAARAQVELKVRGSGEVPAPT
jgi:hypothetical protein